MGRLCFSLACLVITLLWLVQATEVRSGHVAVHEATRADPPSEGVARIPVAEAPEIRRLGKHHSTDKSVGGEVIIGGLVTAIFAAVYCYIRVTRRSGDGDKK